MHSDRDRHAEGPRVRNVFVLGLDDLRRGELEATTNAGDLAFHGLLDEEWAPHPTRHSLARLLHEARAELAAFDGTIDAIISHGCFPTSVLASILAHEHGIAAPSLESVIKCEHGHYRRLEQARWIPEAAPGFSSFDPFDDDPLAHIELDYPFRVEPVGLRSSRLGFRVERAEDFHRAIAAIRELVTDSGDDLDEVPTLVELPDEVARPGASGCIAEEIVPGTPAATEGTMHAGEFDVHGVVGTPRGDGAASGSRIDYPADLPDDVHKRMIDASERFVRGVGFDDGCFNARFLYDEAGDRVCLTGVRTWISPSLADLFAKVDGMSNLEVAVDVALGVRPAMPDGRGSFAVASRALIHATEVAAGIVRAVPSDADIIRVKQRFPETRVQIDVTQGECLADPPDGGRCRHRLGALSLGADSHEEIAEAHRACLEMLPFELAPSHDGI